MLDGVSARLVIALAVLSFACSPRPAPSLDAAVTKPTPSLPRSVPEASVPAAPSSGAPPWRSERPAHGCVIAYEQRLTEGALALAAFEASGPVVYALSPDARALIRWTRDPSARFVAGASVRLDAPVVRAAVLPGAPTEVVIIDERAELLRLMHGERGFVSSPRVLAKGVDRRFAPALARVGSVLLTAYVTSVADAMHTMLVTSLAPAPRDLTPPGHGAAAPTFVLGAVPPVLVLIDARAGVSPLLEVPFDAKGEPGAAIVRTPVSQPYAPPLLVAVASPEGEIEVAYSAVGRVAMTAIGRVPLRRTAEAVALSPSRGYGDRPTATSPARARYRRCTSGPPCARGQARRGRGETSPTDPRARCSAARS